MYGIWGGRVTGNRQLGIRKNAEKSYGDFSAFLCGREEKVKLYLYSLSIRKELGAGMTTFLLPKEALIKSLSDFTLGFLCIARNNLTRIASYLRKVMTKLCIKILVESDSAI